MQINPNYSLAQIFLALEYYPRSDAIRTLNSLRVTEQWSLLCLEDPMSAAATEDFCVKREDEDLFDMGLIEACAELESANCTAFYLSLVETFLERFPTTLMEKWRDDLRAICDRFVQRELEAANSTAPITTTTLVADHRRMVDVALELFLWHFRRTGDPKSLQLEMDLQLEYDRWVIRDEPAHLLP